MVVKYQGGESTYFPGFTTSDSTIEFLEPSEVARRVLKNRRELELLELPSVMHVAEILAERMRRPDVWIRNAVTTIDRFGREVCDGDLEGTLAVCLQDPMSAELLLENYRGLHADLSNIQMVALMFGPKLWLAFNGVEFVWDEGYAERPRIHIANSTKGDFDPAVRLFMLSLIGTGLNFDELATIRIKDAGSLDSAGNLVPNLRSNPLALEFDTEEGRRITFLGEEARASLVEFLDGRDVSADEEPLIAPADTFDELRAAAEARGKSTIASNSRVDRVLCSTVGSFFLKWGIPGRNFYAENGLPNPYEKNPTE
jgi:hypothetical protein